MEITGQGFRVQRIEDSEMVVFEGTLRLSGTKAYAEIAELLHGAGEGAASLVTLDMRNLKFLNSSGLNMLYKFAFNLGRKGGKKLIVRGSNAVPWQKKVFSNLNRFVEDLEVDFS